VNPKYKVELSIPALQDLRSISRWIVSNDSKAKAKSLLNKLQKAMNGLSNLPSRGHALPELESVGFAKYLQIHEGPYRIIYHTQDQIVYIDAVLDGRRDMQTLLSKRLIG